MTTAARIVLGIVLLVVALVLGLVGSQMFARAQIRASDAQRRVERYASPDTSELTSAQAALAGVCALLLVALVRGAGGAILLLRAVAAGGAGGATGGRLAVAAAASEAATCRHRPRGADASPRGTIQHLGISPIV